MKPIGTRASITLIQWDGELPVVGDWLRTKTGRTYEVIETRGRRMVCLVIDPLSIAPAGIRIYSFYWMPRKKKK